MRAWFKDVYSRALAAKPEQVGTNLTNAVNVIGKLFASAMGGLATNADPTDEDVYTEAVTLLGSPVVLPEAKKSGVGGWFDKAKESLDVAGQQKRERDQKMATVQAGIENLQREIVPEKQREKQQMLDQAARAEAKTQARIAEQMNGAMSLLANAQGAEAAELLQSLVKTAPVKSLGLVLVGLSQCAYFTGNSMDSAKNIQDAICFGANSPQGMDPAYNDLWAKAASGLPKM